MLGNYQLVCSFILGIYFIFYFDLRFAQAGATCTSGCDEQISDYRVKRLYFLKQFEILRNCINLYKLFFLVELSVEMSFYCQAITICIVYYPPLHLLF